VASDGREGEKPVVILGGVEDGANKRKEGEVSTRKWAETILNGARAGGYFCF
jgi:hypothetical protein